MFSGTIQVCPTGLISSNLRDSTSDFPLLPFVFFADRLEILTSSHYKVSQNHVLYAVYIIYGFLYYFCDLIVGSQHHLRMTTMRNISYSPPGLPSTKPER